MAGLWWEEFEVGREYDAGERAVTQSDVEAFAAVSGDRNALHLDEEYARGTPLGGRVAHGVLGLAVATGRLYELGLTRGTLVALVGVEWRFVARVRPGDALRVRVRVAEKRPTSRPERGLVRFALTLERGSGEVVQEGVLTSLVRRGGKGRGTHT